jgi:hypothetical protein
MELYLYIYISVPDVCMVWHLANVTASLSVFHQLRAAVGLLALEAEDRKGGKAKDVGVLYC